MSGESEAVQNQHYDESFMVDDPEDVASNVATPDLRGDDNPERGESTDVDRGGTPPEALSNGDQSDYDEEDDAGNGAELRDDLGQGVEDAMHQDSSYGDASRQSFDDGPGQDRGDDLDNSDQESEDEADAQKVEGEYDPAEYQDLAVGTDIKEMFTYITRYTPSTPEIETRLRPFIPDYIPAVGDIDAMIKVDRTDGKNQGLGLECLDEPCAKQSDRTVLDLQLRSISKTSTTKAIAVKKIGGGGGDGDLAKEIDSWIQSITELHRDKPPQNVTYSGVMPEIETLMQEWPPEFQRLLGEIKLPSADLNVKLNLYVPIICALCDIPVYKKPTGMVEALHLLFSTYIEFKNSQHFKARDAEDDDADGAEGGNPDGQINGEAQVWSME